MMGGKEGKGKCTSYNMYRCRHKDVVVMYVYIYIYIYVYISSIDHHFE